MFALSASQRVLLAYAATLITLACPRPAAAVDSAPTDPEVAQIVAEISAQRIGKRIEKLAGFHTRHTLSETESDTRGIGAARRWIESELRSCSKASGGRLQVAMDEYIEPASRRMPRPTTLVNVVATLPGVSPQSKDRMLVVSGHYDSRASDVMNATGAAPGANDDASGVAAVMELACVMAAHEFDATLVFMAVAGEEQGLLGSTHWAKAARSQGLRIEAMITNDIIGSATGDAGQHDAQQVRLFADGFDPLLRMLVRAQSNQAGKAADADDSPSEATRAQLQQLALAGGGQDLPTHQLGRHLKAAGERYVPGFTVNLIQRRDRYLRGGDHLPFLERGYAAVRFTEPFENFQHQHQDLRTEAGVVHGDLIEFVDMPYLANVTRINAAGLATLALAPAAPQNVKLEAIALDNNSTLRWDADLEPKPTLKGYRVLWRDSGAPTWQHSRDVRLATRTTIEGVSKDNVIFGVQAISARGHASLASYPLPLNR